MKSSTKNKILIAGVLLGFFLSYKLSLEKTLDLRKTSKTLVAETKGLKDLPRQFHILSQEEKHYDSLMQKMALKNTSVQNNLLRVINQEAQRHNIKVLDFNEPHVHKKEANIINTFSLELQGAYTNILKTMHTLEQKGNFGEIVHVGLEKKKNYKNNQAYLTATLLIQQAR
ncbi:hypothetical protein [Spongiimicrobium sp. 3-5]|uniref:hypothetical protein n=1 Tax=Spongiimicrobium sp. 3-5 TaxID=3332596 RepID=UPI0039814895